VSGAHRHAPQVPQRGAAPQTPNRQPRGRARRWVVAW